MPSAALDRAAAEDFLRGFLQADGNTSLLAAERVVEALELACAAWLAWDAVDAAPWEYTGAMLRRLEMFAEPSARRAFTRALEDVFVSAR